MNEYTWKATGYSILLVIIILLLASTFFISTISDGEIEYLTTIFLACDYVGMALCALLFLILVHDALRDRSAFAFTIMVVVTYFELFAALTGIVLQGNKAQAVFILLDQYAIVFLSIVQGIALWYYVCYASDRRGPLLDIFRYLANIIFVAEIVFLVLNLFYNHLFYVDEMGEMVYPYGYIGPMALAFILGCETFITILIYTKGIRKRLSLGAYILIPFAALVIGYYIGGNGFIYIAYLLALFVDYSNVYVKRRQELIQRDAKLLQQRADILISQIQPHFLYNALTSIMNIKGNPPETKDAIAEFGKYLRGNLDILKQKGPIPIMLEMDHVETFSELVKLNSGDDLTISVQFNDKNFLIPSLTVQSVLEYVIEMGFGIKHMEGLIDINIFESKNGHHVIISDDQGLVKKCFEMSKGNIVALGLSAIEIRLREMVGGTLTFNSLADDIVVTITVPKTAPARNGQIPSAP